LNGVVVGNSRSGTAIVQTYRVESMQIWTPIDTLMSIFRSTEIGEDSQTLVK
jgi:hypothetical protein